ncbi:hypothetical protein DVY93_05450 [Psychrobacter sp. CCUG 69069]|nr:hypothetical protein [Psychrobacter sp. CCUG 69069]
MSEDKNECSVTFNIRLCYLTESTKRCYPAAFNRLVADAKKRRLFILKCDQHKTTALTFTFELSTTHYY